MGLFDKKPDFYSKEGYVPTAPFTQIIYDIHMCKDFLGIEQEFNYDNNIIYVIMDSCSSYIRNYTQMTDEELDKHHESSLVFLMLLSEFYTNRNVNISTGNCGIFNKMLDRMMKQLKQDWL